MPTYDEQLTALKELEEKLKAMRMETSDPLKLAAQLLVSPNPRQFISRQLGNVLMALLMPAVQSVHDAEVRTQTNMELFDLALLLTIHHGKTGSYPDSLEALVPGLIANEALGLEGEARGRALDAYAKVRETVALAPRLSLDPAATVFQIGTILAAVSARP